MEENPNFHSIVAVKSYYEESLDTYKEKLMLLQYTAI